MTYLQCQSCGHRVLLWEVNALKCPTGRCIKCGGKELRTVREEAALPTPVTGGRT